MGVWSKCGRESLGDYSNALNVLLGSWLYGTVDWFSHQVGGKIVGLSLLTALPMAALGGCWWPSEVVSESLQEVAFGLPTGWTLYALHQLITFGGTLSNVLSHLGVLCLFGLAVNLAAVRFFRV